MKFDPTLRMVANVVISCALLFSAGAAAAQSPSGDVSSPDTIVLSPPTNPDWSINRVSSHWLTQDFPLNTNDSHSFAIDSQGHPQVVYGMDRLYHAVNDGSGWKYLVVDDYRGGVSDASIDVSYWNFPTASYCRRGTLTSAYQPLMYADYAFGAWYREVVDDSPRACASTSIAEDHVINEPVIAYYNPGASEIRVAYIDSTYHWHITTVVSGVGNQTGGVNLVVDSNNTYWISYFNSNGVTHNLYLVKSRAGGWDAPLLVPGSPIHAYNSLAVDSVPTPHLAFVQSDGKLVYATLLNDNTFNVVPVRTPVSGETYDAVSLAFGSNNVPYIGYHEHNGTDSIGWAIYDTLTKWAGGGLIRAISPTSWFVNIVISSSRPRLVYLSGHSLVYDVCSDQYTWQYTFIDDAYQYIPNQTSLAMDVANRARISAYDGRHGYLIRAVENPPASWIVDTMDSTAYRGFYSSEAIAPDGTEHIAYYDITNKDLKITYDTGAGYDTITVPDPSADAGRYVSLKMDTSSRWHLSYYDAANKELKYAYLDSSYHWQIQPFKDCVCDEGKYSSLVLDGSGRPHIAYYDVTNGALKYLYQDSTGWHFDTLDQPIIPMQAGVSLSLAATPNGYGVAYVKGLPGGPYTLNYRRCTFPSGGGACNWSPSETVASQAAAMDYNLDDIAGVSLAFDKSGNPYISFQTEYTHALAVASKKGSTWTVAVVDANSLNTGLHSSLAIDRFGKLHISYIDSTFYGLMVAVQKTKVFLPSIQK